jgi:hypothetical protein
MWTAQLGAADASPRLADIPHCSIARWFTTLFDAQNTLVALEIQSPAEEYVFTDYAETTHAQLVRGTRVESQRVCWVFRNRETGHIVRTNGWLRAVMTPDFGQGVLKMERLEVYYQLAEEFVPRHVAARMEREVMPEDGSSPLEDADGRGEVIAGFEGMARRRNFKASMELPPPLGPYGVTEQVLRFLEVSCASPGVVDFADFLQLATTMLALRILMERSVAETSNPRGASRAWRLVIC